MRLAPRLRPLEGSAAYESVPRRVLGLDGADPAVVTPQAAAAR